VGVSKAGSCAEECEFAAGELLPAKISKFLDERVLPAHDLAKVETYLRRVDAPGSRMAGQVHDFGGVKQGFRWHATAQDTEAAHLLGAFNDDGFEALGRGGSRGRVTATAAADNRQVEVKWGRCTAHKGRMSEQAEAGKREAQRQH